jgi:hypothetical protein
MLARTSNKTAKPLIIAPSFKRFETICSRILRGRIHYLRLSGNSPSCRELDVSRKLLPNQSRSQQLTFDLHELFHFFHRGLELGDAKVLAVLYLIY